MDYRELCQSLFEKGRPYFDEMDVFVESKNETDIQFNNEELEQFSIAESGGLAFRGIKGAQVGAAYSEKIDEEALDELVKMARENLSVSEPDETVSATMIAGEGAEDYPLVAAETLNVQERMDAILAAIKEVRGEHEDLMMVQASSQHSRSTSFIMNSKGLDKQQSGEVNYLYICAVLQRGQEMKNGFSFRVFRKFGEIDAKAMLREAYRLAEETYGSQSMSSGKRAVLLDRRVVGALLGVLESAFSADQMQKGLSLFEGKVGEAIASPVVNIINDPFSPYSPIQKHFDDEGSKTERFHIIKDGVFQTFLYDIKTAMKDGRASSGNGSRSYRGSCKPSAINLSLPAGEKNFEALLAEAGDGLYVTDLQGLHSGIDPISGDFSLPANGFVIEKGKIGRPVYQITVAGNLLDLLKNIRSVAADVEFGVYGAIAPSVLVSELSISGSLQESEKA